MPDELWLAHEFARELETAFAAIAEEVPTPEGQVLLGEVALRALMTAHLDEQTRESMSVSELLLSIADGEPRVLVHHAVRNPGPPDWDWSLDAFRLGERGYIVLIFEEEDEEPGQPVYGAWEPFDSQPAFEACFTAVYERHLDPILFGTHIWLGERISRNLLARALWAGLEGGDSFRWEQLRDYALPLDSVAGRRAVLEYYLSHAPEP